MKWGRECACLGVLLIAGSILGLLTVSPVINPPKWDEFIVVYDAHRIVQGQFPYRDFFNFPPPGIFIYLAGWFGMVGRSSLTAGRYAGLLVMGLTLAVGYAAFRRRLGAPLWSAVWAGLFLALYPFWAIPSHQWLSNLPLVGLVAWLGGADGSPRDLRSWFVGGLLAGLALFTLQVQGIVAVAVCAVHLLYLRGRRPALGWTAGFSIVWVPWFVLLLAKGALKAFLADTILWPSLNYSRPGNENWDPVLEDLWGRLSDIGLLLKSGQLCGGWVTALAGWTLYGVLLLFAAGVLGTAVLVLARVLKRRSIGGPWTAAALLATFLTAGLALRANPNWLHLVFLIFPLVVLWGAALTEREAPRPFPKWALRLSQAALLLALASGALYHARGLWCHAPETWEFEDADRPIREQPINRYLREPGRLKPGETLAAFPEGGEVYLYSGPAAVGYTYFLPLGHRYNSLEDNAVVAEQIEKRRPRFVLVTPDLEKEYLDPSSPLGRTLREHYRRTGAIGLAVLYEPVESPTDIGAAHSSSPQDQCPR